MMLCFGSVEYEGIDHDSGVNMCLGITGWDGCHFHQDHRCDLCRVWITIRVVIGMRLSMS